MIFSESAVRVQHLRLSVRGAHEASSLFGIVDRMRILPLGEPCPSEVRCDKTWGNIVPCRTVFNLQKLLIGCLI